jgi:hypothetical protein
MTLQDAPHGTLRDSISPRRDRMAIRNNQGRGVIALFFLVFAILGLGYALYVTFDRTSPTTRTTEVIVTPTAPPAPVTPASSPRQP